MAWWFYFTARKEGSGKNYGISGRNYHKFLADGDYSETLSNISF